MSDKEHLQLADAIGQCKAEIAMLKMRIENLEILAHVKSSDEYSEEERCRLENAVVEVMFSEQSHGHYEKPLPVPGPLDCDEPEDE